MAYPFIESKWKGFITEELAKNIKKRKEKTAGRQLKVNKVFEEISNRGKTIHDLLMRGNTERNRCGRTAKNVSKVKKIFCNVFDVECLKCAK